MSRSPLELKVGANTSTPEQRYLRLRRSSTRSLAERSWRLVWRPTKVRLRAEMWHRVETSEGADFGAIRAAPAGLTPSAPTRRRRTFGSRYRECHGSQLATKAPIRTTERRGRDALPAIQRSPSP